MEFDVQQSSEFDGFIDENESIGFIDDVEYQIEVGDSDDLGFVDDSDFSNFSLRGKKYHARKRQESANRAAEAERQATAEREATAKQLAQESARKKAEADKQLEEAKAELAAKQKQVVAADVQTQALQSEADKLSGANQPKKSNMTTYLIIGGVALLLIGGGIAFMRRSA